MLSFTEDKSINWKVQEEEEQSIEVRELLSLSNLMQSLDSICDVATLASFLLGYAKD
jgi:hypothetical protein